MAGLTFNTETLCQIVKHEQTTPLLASTYILLIHRMLEFPLTFTLLSERPDHCKPFELFEDEPGQANERMLRTCSPKKAYTLLLSSESKRFSSTDD